MANELAAETRQHMLQRMLDIRYCEERIQELFLENVIRGTTHLCIGQAYALSVFNLPLTKQLGISHSIAGDWKLTELGWIFTIAIFVLGASAALFGKWVQAVGPRKSGLVAALCWGIGFLVGAVGIKAHQLWLVYLGYGLIGGCGLGIG